MHWKKNQTKIKPGAGEVDPYVKALLAEPEDQRSVPKTSVVKRGLKVPSCPLTSTCTLWQARAQNFDPFVPKRQNLNPKVAL